MGKTKPPRFRRPKASTAHPPSRMNLMVGTAGHIDHGKTELVKLLTGCDTDRLKEEKDRGMSINLGFAPCLIPACACPPADRSNNQIIGIVDVPGHEKFIRNMVAGATGIDIVLLVIAADDGVMPQTREHLNIVELLGIKKGLVAITKVDLVDEEVLELVVDETRDLLKGTFLEDAPLAPVSSVTGEGFDKLYESLIALVESAQPRSYGGVFRMPVERAFSVKGYGSVLTGIPVTGKVALDDRLELLPQHRVGRVRGIQVYQSEDSQAFAGECIAVNISDVPRDIVERGNVLAAPGYFEPTYMLAARFHLLPSRQRPLKSQSQIRFHTGTCEVMGRIALLDRDALEPGDNCLAQLRLESPVVVGAGDRYIVRLHSPVVTIGGGVIISESKRKLKRFRENILEEIRETESVMSDERAIVEYAVKASRYTPIDKLALTRAAKLPDDKLDEITSRLVSEGRAISISHGSKFIHSTILSELEKIVLAGLRTFHEETPLSIGHDPTSLRDQIEMDPDAYEAVISSLAGKDKIEYEGGLLKLAGKTVALNENQRELSQRIEDIFLKERFSTPRPDELSSLISPPPQESEVGQMLNLLCEQGALIKLSDNAIFHRQAVDEAKEIATKYLRANGELPTTEFRDMLKTTKKYAVALLDHFGEIGLTARVEGKHFLRETS